MIMIFSGQNPDCECFLNKTCCSGLVHHQTSLFGFNHVLNVCVCVMLLVSLNCIAVRCEWRWLF